MRTAYYEKQWIRTEEGQVAGICLGYDHCAEHEFGISHILAAFGVRQHDLLGVESRQVTKLPARGVFFKKGTRQLTVQGERHNVSYATLMVISDPYQTDEELAKSLELSKLDFQCHQLAKARSEKAGKSCPESSSIFADWDDSGLRVCVIGQEEAASLGEIYDALRGMDLCITLRGFGPFGGAGLCLVVASRVSKEVRDKVLAEDLDRKRLLEKAASHKLEEKVKAAGLRFYALKPAWLNDERTEVWFWLNPCDQHLYNHGWFTPEEILAWTRNEGPVIKRDQKAR